MHFQIADTEGSILDTFSELRAAVSSFRAMVAEDSTAAMELLLLSFTDDGQSVGPARTYGDLLNDLALTPHLAYAQTAAVGMATAVARKPLALKIPRYGSFAAPAPAPASA